MVFLLLSRGGCPHQPPAAARSEAIGFEIHDWPEPKKASRFGGRLCILYNKQNTN